MERGDPVPPAKSAALPGWLSPLGLLVVLAGELALFCFATARHVSWAYPRWLDQLQYLGEAYDGYDWAIDHGFLEGARHALAHVAPQGSLHGLLAMLVFEFCGPTRTAALSLNMLALLALQAALFASVRRVSGSWSLAWASLGLLAACHAPWIFGPGSAFDFRLDWMAACAYGVALCAAVASDGFGSVRGSLAFGVAVGVAVLVRHLTGVYFVLVYLGLFLWLATRPGGRARCLRLALSGLVAAGLSAWALIRARHEIFIYYWGTHVSGAEVSLRDSHLGLASSIRWLARQALFDKMGLEAALICAAAGTVLFTAGRHCVRGDAPPGQPRLRDAWAAAVVFLAAPACVLCGLNEQSPAPASVILAPLVWMIVLCWIHLSRNAGRGARRLAGAAAAVAGIAVFVQAQVVNPIAAADEAHFRSVNALGDFLFFRAEEAGLSRPVVSTTWILDGVDARLFGVLAHERHESRLRFTPLLPTGITDPAPGDVMERLAKSDFVCLVTRADGAWPFDRRMAAMLPEMKRWCEGSLKLDGGLETAEFTVSVYERPALARPRGGRGVALEPMIAAGLKAEAAAPALPPGPPRLMLPASVPWTTAAEFHFLLKAAYSPMTLSVEGLPAGLAVDARTGEIRGSFPHPGTFETHVHAANAVGAADSPLVFHVSGDARGASARAPERAAIGVPVEISFSVFETQATLDFVDITDLSVPRVLARLEAGDDERRIWEGTLTATFREPGLHTVLLRFVRLDPAGAGGYAFVDRECRIQVGP